MTILSAQSIAARCQGLPLDKGGPMIYPFHKRTTVDGMSYGLSPAGYDVRIKERVHLLPGDAILASTIERFDMPGDLLGMVADKSTWARRFLAVQHTVIEPGWRGYLTLELTNHGATIIDISPGMPIAQIIFHTLDMPTDQPYEGKYQDQEPGAQAARLEGVTALPIDRKTRNENSIIMDIQSNMLPNNYLAIKGHACRRENDEMVCATCGKRWPIGEDHP